MLIYLFDINTFMSAKVLLSPIANKGGEVDEEIIHLFVRAAADCAREGRRGYYELSDGLLVPSYFKEKMRLFCWRPSKQLFNERKLILKKLLNEGYDTKIVCPLKEEKEFSDFLAKAESIGAKKFPLPFSSPVEVSWVRDTLQPLEKRVLIYTPKSRVKEQMSIKQALKSKGIPTRHWNGGRWGRTVFGRDFVIVANPLKAKARRFFNPLSFEVYDLPGFIQESNPMKTRKQRAVNKRVFVYSDHIDMRLNILNKEKIILVDSDYLSDNRKAIERIANRTDHLIVEIPHRESKLSPANFLKLPDGKILLNKAPKTAAKLEENGVTVIMPDRPITASPLHHHGSIRCMTTVLPK